MITLLTPTGDRQHCLLLLQKYLSNQNYSGPMRWVIVDDGVKPSFVKNVTGTLEIIRPDWCWRDVGNTQAVNMLLLLAQVAGDSPVLVIEDDDVYLPNHIQNIVDELENATLVGEEVTCYYNAATRRHRTSTSGRHSSLASVGVRGEAVKALQAVCEANKTGIDVTLWREFKGTKKLLKTQNVIGIKGMPGRAGIGIGHRKSFGTTDFNNQLVEWIGEDYAACYARYAL